MASSMQIFQSCLYCSNRHTNSLAYLYYSRIPLRWQKYQVNRYLQPTIQVLHDKNDQLYVVLI